MVRRGLVVLTVCVLAFVIGCSKQGGTQPPGAQGGGGGMGQPHHAPEATQPPGPAPQESGDQGSAAESRDTLVKDIQNKVDDLKKQMQQLGQEASNKGQQIEQNWNSNIKPALQGKLNDLEDQLNKLKSSSGDTWQNLKSGIQKAADNVADAFNKAKDQLQGTGGSGGTGS